MSRSIRQPTSSASTPRRWQTWRRRFATSSSRPSPKPAAISAPISASSSSPSRSTPSSTRPTDSILFDVSHQAYIHKILTGRLDRFATIRQPGGLNGFMLRTESEHDCYGAGHAGTALSAALGMAVARDLAGGNEHVIAVAGDAAFTNGISFEALNNIAEQTKRLIVVLNDNEWSIDRNVGAIARYFHRIVTNEHYQHLHDSARAHRRELRRQDRHQGRAPRRRSRQEHAVALHPV